MNAKSVHMDAVNSAVSYLNNIVAGLTQEQAHWEPPGTVQSIAGTYAHAIISTDWQIHSLFQDLNPLYDGEWKGKTGVSEVSPSITPEWGKSVQVDLHQLGVYGESVFASLRGYVDKTDLESLIDMSVINAGKQTASWCLSSVVVGHLFALSGQISALKGSQGMKGDIL